SFKRNRCLIPASGYFEWHTVGKDKQPYYFTPRNGSVLTFAGLWETWKDRINDETLTSCTILITEANQFVSAIHDRMAVILEPGDFGPWLSKGTVELLKPAPEDALRIWPVSKRVNKVGNADDATLIEPVTIEGRASQDKVRDLFLH